MPELVYNVKFQIDTNIREGVADVDLYKNRVEELEEQLNRLNQAQGRVGKTQRTTNSQLAIGNQAFFSMSDLIQDSTQFSYGFSTGMRAVGNNIGFTAELAGVLAQKVREANNGVLTFSAVARSLGASLFGVGGVILAINTVVTLLTMYTANQDKARRESEKLGEQSSALSNIFARQNKEIQDLIKNLDLLSRTASDDLSRGYRQAGDELQAVQEAIRQIEAEERRRLEINNELIGLSSQFINADGQRLSNLQQQRDELLLELETLDRRAEVNREDLAILESRREELRKTLKELNSEERIAVRTYQTRYKQRTEEITQAMRLFDSQQDQSRALQRQADLYDRINETIKRNGQEARRQREEEREYAAAAMRRFLDMPTIGDGADESAQLNRALTAQRIIEQARIDIASRGQGQLVQAQLRIEQDYQQRRLELIATGLASEENLRLLTIQRDQALTDARVQIHADMVSSIAQSAGVLAGVFGASKDIQIAMAIVDAGAAIVKTFAQLGFPAGIPAAIAVAARTAQTIQQMKKIEVGSATPIGASGGGNFGFQMNEIQGPQTFRTPEFTPTNGSMQPRIVINQELKADRKQLYILNKMGEEEYRQIKA